MRNEIFPEQVLKKLNLIEDGGRPELGATW